MMDEAGGDVTGRNICTLSLYTLIFPESRVSEMLRGLFTAVQGVRLTGSLSRQSMTRTVWDPWSADVSEALVTRDHDRKATSALYTLSRSHVPHLHFLPVSLYCMPKSWKMSSEAGHSPGEVVFRLGYAESCWDEATTSRPRS